MVNIHEPVVTCATCSEPPHGAVACWAHAYNRADTASAAGNDAEATRLRLVCIREYANAARAQGNL